MPTKTRKKSDAPSKVQPSDVPLLGKQVVLAPNKAHDPKLGPFMVRENQPGSTSVPVKEVHLLDAHSGKVPSDSYEHQFNCGVAIYGTMADPTTAPTEGLRELKFFVIWFEYVDTGENWDGGGLISKNGKLYAY